MAKRITYLEKWTEEIKGEPYYFMHRLHPSGDISDDNRYKSRSGRSRKINKILALEPELVVRFKPKK